MRLFLSVLKLLGFGLMVAIVAALASCAGTRAILQQAPPAPKITHIPLSVDLNDPDGLRDSLSRTLYGDVPHLTGVVESRRIVEADALNGQAILSEWRIKLGTDRDSRVFHLALLQPQGQPDAPLILSQNFCPNPGVMDAPALTMPEGLTFTCDTDGIMGGVFGYMFGRYIRTPPLEEIINRGYAFAAVYPGEFIPDSRAQGGAALDMMFGTGPNRPGALSAWAAQFIWLAEAYKAEHANAPVIAYGHSRFGKTGLIASAWSPVIDGVIAHQSGTAGASVMRDKTGESLGAVLEGYPHWLSGNAETYAGDVSTLPVDAQHLLALIAPRPVLLGNAKRDVWSDPNGAFLAAQSADIAWKMSGATGMTTERLDEFDPEADLAFWMRPGTHGVVKEDWPAFLDFLDAHFQK